MANIYKLRYESKAEALKDLRAKNVIDENGFYINGTEALVECNIINDGEHYNIMTRDNIVFDSEVFPKDAKYKFGGHE